MENQFNDVRVAASFYRMKKIVEYEISPICNLLKGAVNELPILEELSTRGVFQYELPDEYAKLNEVTFKLSKRFLDLDENHDLKTKNLIQEGSLNGYHTFGGLSKYNENRCGFIFENEDVLDLLRDEDEESPFVGTINHWRDSFHQLAHEILSRLANQLGLYSETSDSSNDYFDREFNFVGHGQLHMKRCRNSIEDPSNKVRLLAHTDPSLLSLVIHDRPSQQMLQGAMGLQVNHRERRQFESLACGGWKVVTVFAGDILGRISQQRIHAPLHRVVVTEENPRLAATIFIQPELSAQLKNLDGETSKSNPPMTYATWKERKYGKYFQKK